MPLFSARRPMSIGSSIRAMLSSSPNLSAMDMAHADNLVAETGQHTALAEKYRAEVQAINDAQANEAQDRAFRSDPENAINYASTVSGAPLAKVKQWDEARRGVVRPPATPNDDEGNPMPAAVSVDPGLNAQVMDQIKGALGSIGATRFATAPTNADQMTKAGGNLLSQAITAAATNPNLSPEQRIANSEAATGKVVTPYRPTTGGEQVVNEMTGAGADLQTEAAKLARGLVEAKTATEGAHQGALKGQAAASYSTVPLHQAQTRLADAHTAAASATGDSVLNPTERRFMAEQYLAGDKSVLTNLGRGAQGASNIVALRREIASVATEKGMSPQAVASAMAEFQGFTAGQRTLGNRTANIEMAVTEAQNVIPIALAASEKVDRTKYPTLNSLILAAEKGTGDENVVKFAAATNALVNIYSRAIAPSGVPTISDKDHARDIIATAYSKGQFGAVTGIMQEEMAAARKSPGQVRDAMRGQMTGAPPTERRAAPTAPSQADLEFTAQKRGLTVEQVKAQLGIK